MIDINKYSKIMKRLLSIPIFLLVILEWNQVLAIGRAKNQYQKATGILVSYEGGSGGGTFGLLFNNEIKEFTYEEPIRWRFFKKEEDLYLGSILTIFTKKGKRISSVVSIRNERRVDNNVRSVWNVLCSYFERLSKGEFASAHTTFNSALQKRISIQELTKTYKNSSFDLKPFVWVPTNPLARYGLLSYGLRILNYNGQRVRVLVDMAQFVTGKYENYRYELVKRDGNWKISTITLIGSRQNNDAFFNEELPKLEERIKKRIQQYNAGWETGSSNYIKFPSPSLTTACFRGDQAIGISIEFYPTIQDTKAKLLSFQFPPLSEWHIVHDLGDQAVERDGCDRAWVRFRKGKAFIWMNANFMSVKAETDINGCRSNSASAELASVAKEIGKLIAEEIEEKPQ